MKSQVANFVLYQLGWFAIVGGAATGRLVIGSAVALLLLAVHFFLVDDRSQHFLLGVVAAVLGLLVETTVLSAGVYRFATEGAAPPLPPFWIMLMWVQFSALIPFCLSWMSERYWLAAALGLVGGPLAFLAGERLGAVTFLPPRLPHYLLLGACWAVATPALVFAADWLFGKPRTACKYPWLA